MKKSAYILNSIFLLAIIILDIFYIVNGGIILKSITSACFFMLGVINLIFVLRMKTEKIKFSILLLVGLFFAMLGDILLEINFIVGAIFFVIVDVDKIAILNGLLRCGWVEGGGLRRDVTQIVGCEENRVVLLADVLRDDDIFNVDAGGRMLGGRQRRGAISVLRECGG